MPFASLTERTDVSPVALQALRRDVPELTATKLEHLIPNHAMKSEALAFMVKTTARLGFIYGVCFFF